MKKRITQSFFLDIKLKVATGAHLEDVLKIFSEFFLDNQNVWHIINFFFRQVVCQLFSLFNFF